MTLKSIPVIQKLAKQFDQLSEYKKLLKQFEPAEFEQFLSTLTDIELEALMFDLEWQGRPKQQLPDGNWFAWVVKPGRGFGKTWLGGKVIGKKAHTVERIALIGSDIGEVRDIMIEGESGILATAHPSFRPHYNKQLCRLEYPNGSKVLGYSAQEPESLRGPNNGFAWVDELFKFRYQQALWDELVMTMRSGANPQVLITSTPRPTKLCKELVADRNNIVTNGSMGENDALPARFIDQIEKKYGGTRRGRQEIDGEILDDNPGALWKLVDIERARVKEKDKDGKAWFEQMDRIVVAVDPATTSNEETSDATGLIVCGRKDDQGYVFSDDTLVATPSEWGNEAVSAYNRWKADRLVAETNNGGDMVETIIRNIQPSISYRKVHATRGKAIRAEPVAALYEQGRIHHVGAFDELEAEMLEFDPGLGRDQKSPNRMDALVWAFAELFGDCFAVPEIYDLDDY